MLPGPYVARTCMLPICKQWQRGRFDRYPETLQRCARMPGTPNCEHEGTHAINIRKRCRKLKPACGLLDGLLFAYGTEFRRARVATAAPCLRQIY